MIFRSVRRRAITVLAAIATVITIAAPANGSASGDADTEVPILTGFSFSPSSASPGTLVNLNISATDAQTTVYAEARLKNIDVEPSETVELFLQINRSTPLSLPSR